MGHCSSGIECPCHAQNNERDPFTLNYSSVSHSEAEECGTSVMPFSSRRDADAEPTRATARARMQNIRAAILIY